MHVDLDFLIAHSATIKRLHTPNRQAAAAVVVAADEVDAAIERTGGGALDAAETVLSSDDFWKKLDELLSAAGSEWTSLGSKIWSFGPKRLGSNVLVDSLPGSKRSCVPAHEST